MQALLNHLDTLEQDLHNTPLFTPEQQTALEQNFKTLCDDLFSKNPLQAVTGEFSPRIEIPEVVQIGTIVKPLATDASLQLPALIPFRDTQGLCFAINDHNKEQVHTLMQAMALQLIQQIPLHLVDCLFVDLKTLGRAFRFANSLSPKIKRETITTETALRNTLNDLLEKQTLIINQYLTHRYKNLADYNQQADLQERFKFLFKYLRKSYGIFLPYQRQDFQNFRF
jgi:hypothetical protein